MQKYNRLTRQLIYPPNRFIVSAQTRLTYIGLTETVLSVNLHENIPDEPPTIYVTGVG